MAMTISLASAAPAALGHQPAPELRLPVLARGRGLPGRAAAPARTAVPALAAGWLTARWVIRRRAAFQDERHHSAAQAHLLAGEIVQEAVHERLHRGGEPGNVAGEGRGWLAVRRREHGFHHARDARRAFGTLSGFWDRLLGTAPRA